MEEALACVGREARRLEARVAELEAENRRLREEVRGRVAAGELLKAINERAHVVRAALLQELDEVKRDRGAWRDQALRQTEGPARSKEVGKLKKQLASVKKSQAKMEQSLREQRSASAAMREELEQLRSEVAKRPHAAIRVGVTTPWSGVERMEVLEVEAESADCFRRFLNEHGLALFDAFERCKDFMQFFDSQNPAESGDAVFPYLDRIDVGLGVGRFTRSGMRADHARHVMQQLVRKEVVLAEIPDPDEFCRTHNAMLAAL